MIYCYVHLIVVRIIQYIYNDMVRFFEYLINSRQLIVLVHKKNAF